MRKFILLSFGIAFFLPLFYSAPSLAADVSTFDIDGFSLGMTREQAGGISAKLTIEPVTYKGIIQGYKGKAGPITLYFTEDTFAGGGGGIKVFQIVKTVYYDHQPDVQGIFNELSARYGMPDYTGRSFAEGGACWGKCRGAHTYLKFDITVQRIGSRPPVMTLTLLDGKMALNIRDHIRSKR